MIMRFQSCSHLLLVIVFLSVLAHVVLSTIHALLLSILLVIILLLLLSVHLRHAVLVVGLAQQAHAVLPLLVLVAICALTQHDDLVLGLSVLPAAKDEQVRADCRRCVTETNSWWLAEVFAPLPGHGVGRPNLEVVALLFSAFVLEAST